MPRIEFSADGIRGIAGEWPLVPAIAVRIGQALGRHIYERSEHPFVVIGCDTRPSGKKLLHCLAAGLTGQGIDVINLGVITTPGVAFLARRLHADLGVIVSASHSPIEYNGIKLVGPNGLRLQREDEIEIEGLIDEFIATPHEHATALGQETDGEHLIEVYIQHHVEHCPARSLDGLKVVLDCADGAAYQIAPEAFRRLGAEVAVLNQSADGKSINYRRGSEHVRNYPQDLAEFVRQHEADYGFSFDGDGDRLVVVDPSDRVFDGHDLLFVLALYFRSCGLLRRDKVVTCYQSNLGLGEALAAAGIRVVYTSNGDKNLEEAMWEGDYLLGGEPGGNIIINDGHHTAADAVYTALVLSGVLVHNGLIDLAEMVDPLCKRPQVTVWVRLPVMLTFEQRVALQEEIRHRQAELGNGSRILAWDSSTEPRVFRVMVEGGCESVQERVLETAEALRQLIQRRPT